MLKHQGIAATAAAIAIACGPVAGAAEVTIIHPTLGIHRVDICFEWGSGCDGEAAEAYCTGKGYTRAVDWEVDADIGATHSTMVIGTGQVCAEAFCDGYLAISCRIEDDWTQSTGNGGLLVDVRRQDEESPEGLLAVAISEADPRIVVAAPVDVMGLAFLHAGPGHWRLFLLNHKNAKPVPPPPAEVIEVPAGPAGMYALLNP